MKKIVQLCPAAPGWRYLFVGSKTEIWEVPIACWALLESGVVVGMGKPYIESIAHPILLQESEYPEIMRLLSPDEERALSDDEIAFQEKWLELKAGVRDAKFRHGLCDNDAEELLDSLDYWDSDKAEALCQYAKSHNVNIGEAHLMIKKNAQSGGEAD